MGLRAGLAALIPGFSSVAEGPNPGARARSTLSKCATPAMLGPLGLWLVCNGAVTERPQSTISFNSSQFVNQLGLAVNIHGLYRVLT